MSARPRARALRGRLSAARLASRPRSAPSPQPRRHGIPPPRFSDFHPPHRSASLTLRPRCCHRAPRHPALAASCRWCRVRSGSIPFAHGKGPPDRGDVPNSDRREGLAGESLETAPPWPDCFFATPLWVAGVREPRLGSYSAFLLADRYAPLLTLRDVCGTVFRSFCQRTLQLLWNPLWLLASLRSMAMSDPPFLVAETCGNTTRWSSSSFYSLMVARCAFH